MYKHGLKSTSSIYKACNKDGQEKVCDIHVFWYDDYIKEIEMNVKPESEAY